MSDKTPFVGTKIAFTGRVKTPGTRRVVLQRKVQGRWVKVAKARTHAKFTFVVPVTREGKSYFRVRVAATDRWKPATSKRIRVVGKRRPSGSQLVFDPQTSVAEDQLMLLINQYRDRSGVNDPLYPGAPWVNRRITKNDCLYRHAKALADHMVRTDKFAHSNNADVWGQEFAAQNSVYTICAPEIEQSNRRENLSLVNGSDPYAVAAKVLEGWQRSPAHNSALLADYGMNFVGSVAISRSRDGYWWVVFNGASRSCSYAEYDAGMCQ